MEVEDGERGMRTNGGGWVLMCNVVFGAGEARDGSPGSGLGQAWAVTLGRQSRADACACRSPQPHHHHHHKASPVLAACSFTPSPTPRLHHHTTTTTTTTLDKPPPSAISVDSLPLQQPPSPAWHSYSLASSLASLRLPLHQPSPIRDPSCTTPWPPGCSKAVGQVAPGLPSSSLSC